MTNQSSINVGGSLPRFGVRVLQAQLVVLVAALMLIAFPGAATGANSTLICYIPAFESVEGVRITPINEVSRSPGDTISIGWDRCGGHGLAIAGPASEVRAFAAPEVRAIHVERSVGGRLVFTAPPNASASEWPVRFRPEPDKAPAGGGAELVRAWNVDIDVPDDIEPGSYYAAIDFERSGGETAGPLTSYLVIDIPSDTHDDARQGVEARLAASIDDGSIRFDYVVDNASAYTKEVSRRFVDAYSLFDRLPKRESELIELDPDPGRFSALVPREDRRVLRFQAQEAPFISCAAYIASYKTAGSEVRTLTTVRLPWGAYTRQGRDIDECDGIADNPVGRAALGMTALVLLGIGVAMTCGAYRVVRRRRRRFAGT